MPTATLTHGDTRVGSDKVTITLAIRGGLTMWRDPEGQLHNPDGPALIGYDGREQMFCIHGHKHRLDGPAYTDQFGTTTWFANGLKHRIGAPAVESRMGTEFWVNGKLHNVDGPAIVGAGGKQWWVNGERHRDGKPAVETSDGHSEYWFRNVLTRADGPAVKKAGNLGLEWWLDGVRYPDAWAYRDAGGKLSSEYQAAALIAA